MSHAETMQPQGRSIWQRWRRDPLAVFALTALALVLLVALLAPWITPHDPMRQVLPKRLTPPAWTAGGVTEHWLGTDQVGRDLTAGIIYGLRISLLVGAGATAISLALGLMMGLISGWFGGGTDVLLMRLVDLKLALPSVLVALAVMAVWGRGVGKLILVVGLMEWALYARTARAGTLSVKNRDFIESARATGASDLRIMGRHILPNIITPIIILAAVQMPRVIMLEATLSFLGLGVPVNTPSLGILINRGYAVLMSGHWWVSVLPGVALMIIVLAINLLGDWFRDVLDPRSQT